MESKMEPKKSFGKPYTAKDKKLDKLMQSEKQKDLPKVELPDVQISEETQSIMMNLLEQCSRLDKETNQCTVCDTKFEEKFDFVSHLRTVHPKISPVWHCRCGNKAHGYNNFISHLGASHLCEKCGAVGLTTRRHICKHD